jgi:hypothetical protein
MKNYRQKSNKCFFLICILSGWYRHNPLIFQKSNNWLNQLKKLNGMGWFTFRLPDNKYVVFLLFNFYDYYYVMEPSVIIIDCRFCL